MKVTYDKIHHIFHKSTHEEVEEFMHTFNKYSEMFGFENEAHVNMFLAQLQAEIGTNLTPKSENLNYSCSALKKLFGYYKRNPKQAERDGRCNGHRANIRNIANHAYNGRIGNKKGTNDGWMFRGRSYIQLTGRYNYKQIATALSLVLGRPITAEELASEEESVEMALLMSMAFFFTHKMYKAKNIDEMTHIVNAKTPTYKLRKKYYKHIASL